MEPNENYIFERNERKQKYKKKRNFRDEKKYQDILEKKQGQRDKQKEREKEDQLGKDFGREGFSSDSDQDWGKTKAQKKKAQNKTKFSKCRWIFGSWVEILNAGYIMGIVDLVVDFFVGG